MGVEELGVVYAEVSNTAANKETVNETNSDKKAMLSQRRRTMRAMYGWFKNFRESLAMPMATFPKLLMGICCDRSY